MNLLKPLRCFFPSSVYRSRRRPGQPERWRPRIEGLESRLVPTCSPSVISGGVLTLNCDNSGNIIETYEYGQGTEFPEQLFSYWNGSGYSTTGDFYSRFSSIRINPGAGNNSMFIDNNADPLLVNSGGGLDNVYVGHNGIVFSAPITVQNPPANGYTFLHVADYADTGNLLATLTGTQLVLGNRATINFQPLDLRELEVDLGNATNLIHVQNTPQSGYSGGMFTLINTGTQTTNVEVFATTGRLVLDDYGTDSVSVTPTGILAPVIVEGQFGTTDLSVDDFPDSTARTISITNSTVSYGSPYESVQYNHVHSLFVEGESGPDVVHILGTAAGTPTTFYNHDPVQATITVGNSAGSLDDIQGPLSVSGFYTHQDNLIVNDAGNNDPNTNYLLTPGSVSRASTSRSVQINYAASVGNLTVDGGSGTNIFSVEGIAAGVNTIIYGGAGYNQFGAGDGNSNALYGPLALHGQPGSDSFMEYWDYLSPMAQTYTVTTNTITEAGRGPVTFDGLAEVIFVPANVGGNTINVQSVAAGVLMNIDGATGDTVTVGANQSLASVQGSVVASNVANVLIDDSADPTPPAGPVTLANDPTYGFSITGLAPSVIYLNAAPNTTINASLLLGAGNKTINVQAMPQSVALALDGGSGSNTLDYTGFTGNVVVDLPLGSATGFGNISEIENVTGASGGGPGSYNLLIGNGHNVLTGGTGQRNILVAGGSSNGLPSTLNAGDGEDLLIGGSTIYDTDPALASWLQIAAYWAGTDDYFTRVANLTSGNGVPLLDATTVTGNGGGNIMNGNGALALIYSDGQDSITGFDPNSIVVPITP